ncbi:MAG: LuxR C-terminal-related transcriptional regulator [Gaiellales bacterium]
MPLRVVLGEDSHTARQAILAALGSVEQIEVVAACADLEGLRSTIDSASPDVVLANVRLPPGNTDEGIRLAEELRSSHPGIGVVVLSPEAEPRYAVSLLQGGSDRRAYLLMDRLHDDGELERALNAVAAGGSVVDPKIVEQLIGGPPRRRDAVLGKLTPREREILGLMAEARSNGAIARRLGISTRAVERHINAVFGKLDLRDGVEANRRVQAVLTYLEES